MKARLAHLLTKRAESVLKYPQQYGLYDLYTLVYPKIHAAIGDGQMNVIIVGGLETATIEELVKQGYTVTCKKNSTCDIGIDWNYPEDNNPLAPDPLDNRES